MAELVVITGGSFSGKTAVVRALGELGYDVLPEAAMEVIRELNDRLGTTESMRWRQGNIEAFQRQITVRQHEREVQARQTPAEIVFCDRGALDGEAYCRLVDCPWPCDLSDLAVDARYTHVFVLDTLTSFDERAETGRIHTHADSLRVRVLLEEVYRGRAPAITRVREASIEQRVNFVLESLGFAAAC